MRCFRLGGAAAVLFVAGSCELTDPRTIVPSDVLTLRIDSTSLLADSVSRMVVEVHLLGDGRTDADVRLTADNGRFVGAESGKPAELNLRAGAHVARATFVSGFRAGLATLSATVAGVRQDTAITLRPSRPISIGLVPAMLAAKAGTESIPVTATLIRPDSAGVVSYGTRVDFVVTDTLGIEFPDQRAVLLYNGAATALVHRLTQRTPNVVMVRAQVGEGSAIVTSNAVRLTFNP